MLIPFAFALTQLVEGETCPAPGDVERRVRAILHLSDEQMLSETFLAERREAGLFVELRGADSTSIGERLLPSEGSCDELAQAAAVVLSAWLTDVHPDFALDVPAASPPTETPAPPSPPPPSPPRVTVPLRAERAPRLALTRYRFEMEVGAGAGIADGRWTLAGSVAAAVVPGSGLGARSTVLVDTARREPLGGGSVTWRRWPVSLGPVLRFNANGVVYDVSLAPALVWLRVAGADFEPNRSRNAFTWAGVGEVRAASRGRFGWFAALQGQAYLVDSSAYVGGDEYQLPRFALTLWAGARLAP